MHKPIATTLVTACAAAVMLLACSVPCATETMPVACGPGNAPVDEDTVIVVAMHGIPAIASFSIVGECMMLEAMLEGSPEKPDPQKAVRLRQLQAQMKSTPLRADRPYQRGADRLGRLLAEKTGRKVYVGYNEFCAPSLEKVFADAAAGKPEQIIVVTTLSAYDNNHAADPEGDILGSVLAARRKYPDIEIKYAWPYRFERITRLLYEQLLKFAGQDPLAAQDTCIILAHHGTPPLDMPHDRLMQFMMLHGMPRVLGSAQDRQHAAMDEEVRKWPRTDKDSYWSGTIALGNLLEKMAGIKTVNAYNEFCWPGIEEAIDNAVEEQAKHIFVLSPMWEPDNPHSRGDVSQAVRRAQRNHPDVAITYAWPFDDEAVIGLLYDQLCEFRNKPGYAVP